MSWVRDGGKERYAWESPPQVRPQVRLFSCLGRKAEYRGPEAWKIIGGSWTEANNKLWNHWYHVKSG